MALALWLLASSGGATRILAPELGELLSDQADLSPAVSSDLGIVVGRNQSSMDVEEAGDRSPRSPKKGNKDLHAVRNKSSIDIEEDGHWGPKSPRKGKTDLHLQSKKDEPKSPTGNLTSSADQGHPSLWFAKIKYDWRSALLQAGSIGMESKSFLSRSVFDSSSKLLGVSFFALAIALVVYSCAVAGQDTTCSDSNERNQYLFENRLIYEWTQTPETITIYIAPTFKSRRRSTREYLQDEIEVDIQKDHISIGKKNKPPFLNDELYDTIDVEGSSWFISDRKEIEICLQKVEDADWPCVIPSHDEGHSSN